MRKKREFSSGICHICGFYVGPELTGELRSSVDYIHPKSKGGNSILSNIEVCHLHCNRLKGNRPITEELRNLARVEISIAFREWEQRNGKLYVR